MNLQEIAKRQGGLLEKPDRIVELPLAAWADIPSKPAAPMPIGLRLPSEEQVQQARADALEAVSLWGQDGEAADKDAIFNDAIIVEIIAHAACAAVNRLLPFFENPLELRRRLTSDGIRRLWQELEALTVASNPAMPELTDDGMTHLWAIWEAGVALEWMPPEEARKIRRLLEYARQELSDAEERAEKAGVIVRAG